MRVTIDVPDATVHALGGGYACRVAEDAVVRMVRAAIAEQNAGVERDRHRQEKEAI